LHRFDFHAIVVGMIRLPLLVLASLSSLSAAAVRSGSASADWLTATSAYQAGKPVVTALRLVLDDGWHTYWSNPGEGGMKISVKWELPEGWTASDPAHPVPKRFFTGDLPGFGYEGTVLFPVTLTPPPGASGEVKLAARVSWLTCDDQSCVPGDAQLSLDLAPGDPAATADAAAIAAAEEKVPRPATHLTLDVRESDAGVELLLTAGEGFTGDPATAEVFPETPGALDAAAPIHFSKTAHGWKALAPKNEYATGPLEALTLVLAGGGLPTPASVAWTAK
jgi:DsbC/DsbD-like thiol-disulfide interchange protein